MTISSCQLAIVGAGPYGLSAAAHFRDAGLGDVAVFGRQPMSFWSDHMPNGMKLRSPYVASHIADPRGDLSLDAYQSATGVSIETPVPLEHFIQYGRWYQKRVAPDLVEQHVDRIDVKPQGFTLSLESGEAVRARTVVVATGIAPFAHRPREFDGLPGDVVSHACDHTDLSRFAGLRVLVVGGGQSALESAALLHEAGATVRLAVRAPVVHWLGQQPWLRSLGPISRLLYTPQEVGPPLLCQLVSAPNWYRKFPRRLQDRWHTRSIRPAGAGWLRPRVVGAVEIALGTRVDEVRSARGGLDIRFDDGTRDTFDHIFLATGYRVDIRRYPFLPTQTLDKIAHVNGYPVLNDGFESSVPGLHFVGAPAAWSFGPLMRFVAGTPFTSAALTRGLMRSQGRRPGAPPSRETRMPTSASVR